LGRHALGQPEPELQLAPALFWNARNNSPNAAFGNNVSSTQAGQAVHANFSAEYVLNPKLTIGAAGYWLQQVTDTKVNGSDVSGRRERVVGLGPAAMVRLSERDLLFFNVYQNLPCATGPRTASSRSAMTITSEPAAFSLARSLAACCFPTAGRAVRLTAAAGAGILLSPRWHVRVPPQEGDPHHASRQSSQNRPHRRRCAASSFAQDPCGRAHAAGGASAAAAKAHFATISPALLADCRAAREAGHARPVMKQAVVKQVQHEEYTQPLRVSQRQWTGSRGAHHDPP
jgi:hypothetical protein